MSGKEIETLRRRTFTVEFKVEAVKLKQQEGSSYAEGDADWTCFQS